MKLVKDGCLVCINCGQVYDYLTADEYVDFYENRHKIRKKSVYHRKYHIINVMDDIAQKNNIQIGYYNREQFYDRAILFGKLYRQTYSSQLYVYNL